jgi:hypothetical protein
MTQIDKRRHGCGGMHFCFRGLLELSTVPACHAAGLLHASITLDTLHPGTGFENFESRLSNLPYKYRAVRLFGVWITIGLHISVPDFVPRPDFTSPPSPKQGESQSESRLYCTYI